jgi:hypothetical protein
MADAARLAALAELERAEAEFVAAEFRWRHTTPPDIDHHAQFVFAQAVLNLLLERRLEAARRG